MACSRIDSTGTLTTTGPGALRVAGSHEHRRAALARAH
jgi:hypothetical protein